MVYFSKIKKCTLLYIGNVMMPNKLFANSIRHMVEWTDSQTERQTDRKSCFVSVPKHIPFLTFYSISVNMALLLL